MSKLVSNQLSKSFGDLQVLSHINLTIEDGEFVALVGPSGCGKTTFLRMVAGLEAADEGAIFLNERQIFGPDRDRGSSRTVSCLGEQSWKIRWSASNWLDASTRPNYSASRK